MQIVTLTDRLKLARVLVKKYNFNLTSASKITGLSIKIIKLALMKPIRN